MLRTTRIRGGPVQFLKQIRNQKLRVPPSQFPKQPDFALAPEVSYVPAVMHISAMKPCFLGMTSALFRLTKKKRGVEPFPPAHLDVFRLAFEHLFPPDPE